MISNIHNEGYGSTVTCYDRWVVVGDPATIRWSSVSASLSQTGSLEVFRYNLNRDSHDFKTRIFRPVSSNEFVWLTSEVDQILHTELTGTVPITSDFDIVVDPGAYFTASEDDYGHAIDLNRNLLIAGNRFFRSEIRIGTASFVFSGSGEVSLFDLAKLNLDPYIAHESPYIVSVTTSSTTVANITAFIPGSQGYGYAVLEGRFVTSSNPYQKLQTLPVTSDGGLITFIISSDSTTIGYIVTASLNTSSLVTPNIRVSGVISTNPYLITINNPNPSITGSFGYSVALNDEWLAVSSIYELNQVGAVYMYKKTGGPFGNDASWSLYQVISGSSISGIGSRDYFGHSIELNKATGSFTGSMIIGTFKPSASLAYVYEYTTASGWQLQSILSPDLSLYQLSFDSVYPQISSSYTSSRTDLFGYSVSIWGNTAAVGAPTDRIIFEYSGSSAYRQGSVYIFERCVDRNKGYYLVEKSYGNTDTIKDNKLGWSVDIWGNYAVAGCPKANLNGMSLCYLRGSLYQQHFCGDDNESEINGQFLLFRKNTSSIDWDLKNVYQVKKRFLNPFRSFGYDVGICESFIACGAPMPISGSDRTVDMSSNSGSFTGSVSDLGDFCGKSYIYNLQNLKEKFYVGNVFYRNGKIVIMTSGSAFDGLLLSTVPGEVYEYTINFKSKQTLYEKQVVCPVDPGEFNVSTNPTSFEFITSSFDINKNGVFDFQDADVLLRYMRYKTTEFSDSTDTNWSSSLLVDPDTGDVINDEESLYNFYSSSYKGTDFLFSQSFSMINDNYFDDLDFNQDNKIDTNDMNIMWKYFSTRLTQKNYETYITPNSEKRFLNEILDFIDERTLVNDPKQINSDFLDYKSLSKADPTGSYLTPFVTTIGLYNNTDLVAIAKLGSPIKLIPDFPINFIVKIDF